MFEFGRVLEYLQSVSRARGQHLFWMFENVASMRADIRDTISECFKVMLHNNTCNQKCGMFSNNSEVVIIEYSSKAFVFN